MPNLYPQSDDEFEKRELEAKKAIKSFCELTKEKIEKNNADYFIKEGGINPYLVKALGMKNIEDTLDFFMYRKVERSLSGSFGNVLEIFIMRIFGGQSGEKMHPDCPKNNIKKEDKPWYCWWDVVIDVPLEEDGKRYKGLVFAVKSGPRTTNDDIVRVFTEEAKKAESLDYRPYLIGVYGTKAQSRLSGLERRGYPSEKYYRIGKEVFGEFLGRPDYYKRALELFGEFGLEEDLSKIIENKKLEIIAEIKEKYGDDFDNILELVCSGETVEENPKLTLDDFDKK